MDPHPTPFPGKTRRSVATSGKAKPEQGKSGVREPSVVAARYNLPQRRVFGTIRSTNAKVEDNNALQKSQQKTATKPRRPAFVQPSGSLKKQTNDNSPKDSRQRAGSAEVKKKPFTVSFREPLPGKGAGSNNGCSPKDIKEQVAAKKPAAVSFREPLPGKWTRGDSPTESRKQTGSSERKKHDAVKDAGSVGNKRPKQVGSSPEVRDPAVAAVRDPQPLAAGKRRSVGSACRNAKSRADEEPHTPVPLLAAAAVKDAAAAAAAQAAATPYLSARDCSKCRLDRLETASYWIAQIKLAESSGKHYVAAAFFRLAFQCNAEPFRRLKSELSSYVERHLTVSKEWPDVCRLYGLLEDEPAVASEHVLSAAEELGKTLSPLAQREAASGDPEDRRCLHSGVVDVAALLDLEREVMEKSAGGSGAIVPDNDEACEGCGVAFEDCSDRCLVSGPTSAETLPVLEDGCAEVSRAISGVSLVEDPDNTPLGSSVKAENYRDTATSSCDPTAIDTSKDDHQTESSSGKATLAFHSSGETPNDNLTESHGKSDDNMTISQLGETLNEGPVSTADACL